MFKPYSALALARHALSPERPWPRAWRAPEPKSSYDAIIIGGGGHGLATAYYLAKNHGMRNVAVLERAYRQVRDSESAVDIESGTALDALRRLIEHDVHYHAQHPELVRLVMNENIHMAEHLKQIDTLPTGNRQVIEILGKIIARGEAEGSLRPGFSPVDLHMNITALSFYNVSNQFTFAHNFGIDMTSPAAVERRARQVADIIIAWVTQKD